MTEVNNTNLDALLDTTLDDIDDLPSREAYPVGTHHVSATFESKIVNEKPCVELSFKYIAVGELVDTTIEPPKAGDESSTLFFIADAKGVRNTFGLGKLKAAAMPFAVFAGSENLKDIIEAVTDVECGIVTKLSKNKNDLDSPYLDVVAIDVV